MLHARTEGWAAGLRLAALALRRSDDPAAFLTDFSGDERSVAEYLTVEILDGLSAETQNFLRVVSVCSPLPAASVPSCPAGRMPAGCSTGCGWRRRWSSARLPGPTASTRCSGPIWSPIWPGNGRRCTGTSRPSRRGGGSRRANRSMRCAMPSGPATPSSSLRCCEPRGVGLFLGGGTRAAAARLGDRRRGRARHGSVVGPHRSDHASGCARSAGRRRRAAVRTERLAGEPRRRPRHVAGERRAPGRCPGAGRRDCHRDSGRRGRSSARARRAVARQQGNGRTRQPDGAASTSPGRNCTGRSTWLGSTTSVTWRCRPSTSSRRWPSHAVTCRR